MDEKTPHLHLCFVPLTADGRLSAKEIIGNRKNLVRWQDEFWQHMVKQYPELERGESTSQTGREHIPPRIFKEMTQLTKQKEQLDALLVGINPFNGKSRAAEISKVLDSYIPNVARMRDQLRKYNVAFTKTAAENEKLKEKNKTLSASLDKATEGSVLKRLEDAKLQKDYEAAVQTLNQIQKKCLTSIVRQTIERRMIGRMSMLDEWSALATFLADMIEKYADVLEVDKMETASRISDVKVPAQKSENPQISVENVTAA